MVPSHVARKMRRAVGLPDVAGVLVRGVAEQGPADVAGIAQGDLLIRVGDRDITDVDDLHDALDSVTPAAPCAVTVLRGNDELELMVTIPAD